MTAYVIFIREATTDQAELDLYAEKTAPLLAELPVTILAAYGRMAVLEGPPPVGIVLASFPTFEEANSWYHGEAYQAIIGHRHKGGIYRGFVVDGLP